MRYLSKLLKNYDVYYGKPVSLNSCSSATLNNPLQTVSMLAAANLSNIPDNRSAISNEIIGTARMKAHFIFKQAKQEALTEGYRKGYEKGIEESKEKCEEAQRKKELEFEQLKGNLEQQLKGNLELIDKESIDFALGLADKIFNTEIGKSDPRYTEFKKRLERSTGEEDQNNLIECDVSATISKEINQVNLEKDVGLTLNPTSISTNMPQDINFVKDYSTSGNFEDIMNLDTESIKQLLRNIKLKDIIVATKGSDELEASIILGRLPERIQEAARSELDYMGLVNEREVQAARCKVAQAIENLLKESDINSNF
jgi:hypothetical protein